MSKIAIIDIDDTLADMRSLTCKALNDYTGKDLHWSKWSVLRVEELYDISLQDFFKLLQRDSIIEKMQPHSESVDFMRALSVAGYQLHLLTARAWHPRAASITERWLQHHGIYYDDVTVCDVVHDKSDIINVKYNRVHLTVDDSASHCRSYVNNERVENVFVYDMPWNKCPVLDNSRAQRIDNLNEILKLLEGA